MINIIKRAYIVFVGLIILFLLCLMSEHNWAYVYEFILWALVGVPVIAYAVYRTVRFIFYGK